MMHHNILNQLKLNSFSNNNLASELDSKIYRVNKKSDFLVKKNHICYELYFIESGFVTIEMDIKEGNFIRHIAKAGEFITAVESFTKQTPSKEILRMTNNAEIYAISYIDFNELLKKHVALEHIFRIAIEDVLIKCQARITDILNLNAEEYYEKLIRDTPEILQAIPQYELASYMGITPPSLSRIRSKIVQIS